MPSKTLPTSMQPKPLPIFPTMGSLQEVIDLAESRLPITDKNDMTSLLAIYHNTLLKAQKDSRV